MNLRRLSLAIALLVASTGGAWAQGQSFTDFILSAQPAPLPLAATDRIPVVLNNTPFTSQTAYVLPGDIFGTVTSITFTGDGTVLSNTPTAPVTTSGNLPATLNTQSPAKVFAGPVSGLAAFPTFRSLVGSDLPNPTLTTLGGIKSLAAVSHQFLTSITTSGVPTQAQPTISDLADVLTRTILGNATGSTGPVTATFKPSGDANTLASITGALLNGDCAAFDALGNIVDAGAPCSGGGGGGSVTSVGISVPAASILGVSGSPITTAGTMSLTTTGTSGGIPYFSSTSKLSSSGALAAHNAVIGGGAGATPTGVAGGTGCVLAWSVSSADPTCSAQPTLGASGTLGTLAFGNATSGTVTLSPIAGALGSVTASLPANTGTLAELNYVQTWTAAQTFGQVQSKSTSQGGTTYTFAATDCGTEVIFTSGSAVTATIPASIVPAAGTNCYIAINQSGTAKVSVNGSAVTPATLVSAGGYTGSSGTAGSMIAIRLTTISAVTTATLMGDGS